MVAGAWRSTATSAPRPNSFPTVSFSGCGAPPERLVDPSYAAAAAKAFGPFEVANRDSRLEGCR